MLFCQCDLIFCIFCTVYILQNLDENDLVLVKDIKSVFAKSIGYCYSPLSVLIEDSNKISNIYFDKRLKNEQIIVQPSVCDASICIKCQDLKKYCRKYGNLKQTRFITIKEEEEQQKNEGENESKSNENSNRSNSKRGFFIHCNLNNDIENWVNVPNGFCARMQYGRNIGQNFTPEWFHGFVIHGVALRVNSIVLISNLKLHRLSLINCDGGSPYIIGDEINDYYYSPQIDLSDLHNLKGNKKEYCAQERLKCLHNVPMNKDIKIYVFSKAKNNFKGFYGSTREAISPLIDVKFYELNENINSFGIANNEQSVLKIKNEKFKYFYNFIDAINCNRKNMNGNNKPFPIDIISHPDEWYIECSHHIGASICGHELQQYRLPWVVFDVQTFVDFERLYLIPDIKRFMDKIRKDCKNSKEKLSKLTMLDYLNYGYNASILHTKGAVSMVPKESMQELFYQMSKCKNQDYLQLSEIQDKLNRHAEFMLILSEAANDMQLIFNDFNFIHVLKQNCQLLLKIFANPRKLQNERYNKRINHLIETPSLSLEGNEKETAIAECNHLIKICDDYLNAPNDTIEKIATVELREFRDDIISMSKSAIAYKCNIVTEITMMFEKHLDNFINKIKNKSRKRNMQIATAMGLRYYKQANYRSAIKCFTTGYQLAQMSVCDKSLDMIKATYNTGAAYHESWKIRSNGNNSDVDEKFVNLTKQHAAMYLQKAYFDRSLLLKQCKQKNDKKLAEIHQKAMEKIEKRLNNLNVPIRASSNIIFV